MATMTQTARKIKSKAERRIRILARVPGKSAGLLRITEGSKETTYSFGRFAADFGEAYRVAKLVDHNPAEIDEVYCVCLAGDESTCECKGFSRWGHCKHVEGLSALAQAGALLPR